MSNVTGNGSIGGHTQFRVNDYLEIGQHAAEYDPEPGQSDIVLCQFCRKLTNSGSLLTKNWVLPRWTFSGHVHPCVFRVK